MSVVLDTARGPGLPLAASTGAVLPTARTVPPRPAPRDPARGTAPTTATGPQATVVLEAAPAAISGVRRWLCGQVALAGADDDAVALAELLGSEVVTNAVRHGDPGGLVTVTVSRGPGLLRVTVTDGGAGRPVVRDPAPDEPGGRGLQLVEMLAAAWGVQEQAVGKSVWFELAVGGPAPA